MKADISQDRQSGRSRGFGTVLFETEEQAQAAIEVRWPPFVLKRIFFAGTLDVTGHALAACCLR